ncbi:MAG: TrkA C-terminal domain-containing protein [Deinococcus sp.]|uniref:aspartate:alanine exchanger family transporter n=1 Tax=Deinococcus sp. TaxID=47478 RepID=UPI0026DB4103|nr:TrkA C-terminal domain-containing protein [Deinococcus sp.]MDO4246899.1 TrkA C-terminal domain-containing protein [Deinococcus sp.]
MVQLLIDNPLLLLFLIAAIGYPLGRINIRGFSLGIAAVLFTGLAFGALDPNLKTPPLLYEFGLVLFVYTIGIASGPAFFSAMKRGGPRDNAAVLGAILLAAGAVVAAVKLLGLKGTYAAGLLAGSLTNTPALAGAIERLRGSGAAEAVQSEPVVAYSVAYPMGVIAMLLAITLLKKLWKVPDAAPPEPIDHRSVRVRDTAALQTLPDTVRIGRYQHGEKVGLAGLYDDQLRQEIEPGDTISLIGPASTLAQVVPQVGEDLGEELELSREHLDMRRMFVSEQGVAGHRLGDLPLHEKYGATVTRIRRGDTDHLADENTVLQLGDRVRVVAPRDQMPALTRLFGDSYHRLSEIDAMTFSVGIALGLLLGLVAIPLGGGQTFKLGLAGGPLIVGLILGAVGQTGPLNWQLPYNANLTLRQIGLILFLAGVGSRSGYAFFSTVASPLGLKLFVAGTLITTLAAVTLLWWTHKVQKVPFAHATGLLAGLQTQPAVLGFATETMKSDQPNISYATVYPVATIAKLILAQLLLGLGS